MRISTRIVQTIVGFVFVQDLWRFSRYFRLIFMEVNEKRKIKIKIRYKDVNAVEEWISMDV